MVNSGRILETCLRCGKMYYMATAISEAVVLTAMVREEINLGWYLWKYAGQAKIFRSM